jgi:peptidoglycan/LPS O-acetylase OafA/YrhL
MWTQKYSRTDAPVRVFFLSRALRILPVFLLVNLALAIAQRSIDPTFLSATAPRWNPLLATASNLFLLGYANLPYSQGALRAAWSLDVEMQFYLIAPLVLFLFTQSRKHILWEALATAACLAGLSYFLFRGCALRRTLGSYGLFFLIGLIFAHNEWTPSTALTTTSLVLAVGIVVICWCSTDWRFPVQNAKHGATVLDIDYKRIAQVALALITAPIALLSVRNASRPTDRSLGELTYVIYLVQLPIMTLHGNYFVHLPPLHRLPSIVVAWIVVGAASWVVYAYFDRPIEQFQKRWVASRINLN